MLSRRQRMKQKDKQQRIRAYLERGWSIAETARLLGCAQKDVSAVKLTMEQEKR